jgi:hypothetical protein
LSGGLRELGPPGASGGAWAGREVFLMAYCLEVAIIDGGDRAIKVVHQFFGYSEREVETYKRRRKRITKSTRLMSKWRSLRSRN